VRVNFNYFISEETFQFVLDAVHLVAEHGWRLLPRYRFDPATALWSHAGHAPRAGLGLDELRYTPAGLEHPDRRRHAPESALTGYLEEARRILAAAGPVAEIAPVDMGPEFERLRWFPLPEELQRELLGS
jgi:hypothetical protein